MSTSEDAKPKRQKRRSGPGQISPRGKGKWLVRVQGRRAGSETRPDHCKMIHGTKTDAETYLRQVLSERDKGLLIEASPLSISAYLDKWLDIVKSKVTISTHDNYTQTCKLYIKPYIGEKKLSALRPAHIESMLAGLFDKGLSARSARFAFTILSTALNKALRLRMISQNPCKLVDPPRVPRKQMQALSPEQAARFVAAAKSSKHGLMLTLAIVTGLRPSEYLGLQWKDLDFESGVLVISRNIVWRRSGGYYMGDLKTAVSRRAIPLPKSLVTELAAHRRTQLEYRLKQGDKYQDGDLIFPSKRGTPLKGENIAVRYFKPLLLQAGLPASIRLYDLRHSCATILLASGESPKVIAERLGHSRVMTTLDIYAHVLPGMQAAASDRIADMILAPATPEAETREG
ncbi:MAG: tyrosine-type recombinase/integrase [Blastocatellia bacterium]